MKDWYGNNIDRRYTFAVGREKDASLRFRVKPLYMNNFWLLSKRILYQNIIQYNVFVCI